MVIDGYWMLLDVWINMFFMFMLMKAVIKTMNGMVYGIWWCMVFGTGSAPLLQFQSEGSTDGGR